MQPLSFLLSQSCPPHHCINPSKAAAAAAVELGHLIFLWKKPVLSWQAPEQCHDVHQGDMDHKVMASRDCFQAMVEDNRTGHWLDSSDGQQHSEVLHFQVKIFFRCVLPIEPFPDYSPPQMSVFHCDFFFPRSSNNGFTLLVPSDMWFSGDWAVTAITTTYPKNQAGSDVWGKTHWVVRILSGVEWRAWGSWWFIC